MTKTFSVIALLFELVRSLFIDGLPCFQLCIFQQCIKILGFEYYDWTESEGPSFISGISRSDCKLFLVSVSQTRWFSEYLWFSIPREAVDLICLNSLFQYQTFPAFFLMLITDCQHLLRKYFFSVTVFNFVFKSYVNCGSSLWSILFWTNIQ